MIRNLSVLLLILLAAPIASAQTPLQRAEEAFEERRFDDATSILESALAESSDNAEAHYLLARVLNAPDNPNRDSNRAGSEINRALSSDPENVLYLVARLEVLREDTWNFLIELLRATQRIDLANRILRLDPDNAYAHEELGVTAIRDYYQYRNAILLPAVAFLGNATDRYPDLNLKPQTELVLGPTPSELDLPPGTLASEFYATNSAVQSADRFDLGALDAQGVESVSLSGRANRAYDRAQEHLRAALNADPRRRSLYDHVVRLAAISGSWADAVPDMTEMYVQYPNDPDMWLYTGLVNHRLGQYEGADVSFRRAIDLMSEEERAAFTDLTLILPPAEVPAYSADPEGFSQRYWTSRDPRFLNAVNERRTEHYARLTEAELLFASDDLRLRGWDTQRGKMYVRYGKPKTDVIIEGSFALVMEAFPGRNNDFVSNEMVARSSRFNVWEYEDGKRFVFEDQTRRNEFRLYSPPADVFGLQSAGNVGEMDYVQRAAETVRETPEAYDFKSPGRHVDLPYRIAEFKGEAGQTDLYVNYGIPLGSPDGAPDGDVDVTVKTGAFLIGADRNLLVERRRTVYGLRGAQIVPFEEARLWTSTEKLTARPGDNQEVSLEFETSSAGTSAVQRRVVDVRDFAGDELQLSDILLAYYIEEDDGRSPGRVVRNGMSVQAAPWGVFAVDDPIYLYVEIYGLSLEGGQSRYELEARLQPKDMSRGIARIARRIFGSRDRGVSSAFEGDGSESDDWRDLILDAADQEPGYYTLTVTVRDLVSGESTNQETDILLE